MNPTEANPTPEANSSPQEASPLRQIRTFQGDVAETIGRQKESLVTIARAEHARPTPIVEEAPEARKARLRAVILLVGSFVLVGAGAFGGWWSYREFVRKTTPPAINVPESRLISAARVIALSASSTRAELIEAASGASQDTLPPGEVAHIDIPLTAQKFMEALEARPPGHLTRALEIFMLGVLGGEEPSIFILSKVSSFENAFAGMLAWESTMAADIGPLFSTRLALRDTAGLSFEDTLSRNKHARVLYSAPNEERDREALLVYSFFDNETLIITDSVESLRTLIEKLSTELLSR